MIDTQRKEVNDRKHALQVKIEEMEASLRGLREQLREEEEGEQHEAIEDLEKYLGDIDNKYSNLRDFWLVIREEFKALLQERSDKRDGDGDR
ncbi:hypothetical protein Q4485_15905 [Granulosicoccaceae sp. 1_MG-2023]|nr:hypothetical protein [Granulosicoccaceae sp. 1_MG-2023]